jgi:ferredoxin
MSESWPSIHFTINGRARAVQAPPMKRLLDVLREDLHLTGTKEGCGEGECGSCSVRMNGELVNSCLVPVLQAEAPTYRPSKALLRTECSIRFSRHFSTAVALNAASAPLEC